MLCLWFIGVHHALKCTVQGKILKIHKIHRSSCLQIFFKIGALNKFAIITGKQLCWSFFLIKLQAFRLTIKRFWHRCFPVKFAKFLRTSVFTENFWWLLLNTKSLSWCLIAPLEVFCKGFVNISYKNASFLILEDSIMAAAYLFLHYNWTLVCKMSFSGWCGHLKLVSTIFY